MPDDPSQIGPLVTTAWLREHLTDPSLRLADCRWYLGEPARGRQEYDRGHIPGAAYVSLDDDLSAPEGPGRHPLPDPESTAARLGNLGFGDDATIVAYDDRGGAVASRMWWMLRSIGHPKVAVLDGGLTVWRREGRALRPEPTTYAPQTLTVRRRPHVIHAERLAHRLGEVTLIDARDADRYRGEHEPVDPVAGHIPTAINVPMTGNLGDDDRFLDPDMLRDRFAISVQPGHDTVVYCGSGVTACHAILATPERAERRMASYPPEHLAVRPLRPQHPAFSFDRYPSRDGTARGQTTTPHPTAGHKAFAC